MLESSPTCAVYCKMRLCQLSKRSLHQRLAIYVLAHYIGDAVNPDWFVRRFLTAHYGTQLQSTAFGIGLLFRKKVGSNSP